jgi:hypothetical protein
MAGTPVPCGPGADWHAALDERDCRRREESERLSAFYEARERDAEKRRETTRIDQIDVVLTEDDCTDLWLTW